MAVRRCSQCLCDATWEGDGAIVPQIVSASSSSSPSREREKGATATLNALGPSRSQCISSKSPSCVIHEI